MALAILLSLFGEYDNRNALRYAISNARDAATTLSLSQLLYPSLGNFITLFRAHVTLYENQMATVYAMTTGQVVSITTPANFVLTLRAEMDLAKADFAASSVSSALTRQSSDAYDQLPIAYNEFFSSCESY